MRVIAGMLRGRRLKTPPPGDQSIRPTSDMGREALFSILQRWPQGGFLDLFGGTGAVAVEAWSRGYAPVTCVEGSGDALTLIHANAVGTGVEVCRADILRMGRTGGYQDLAVIFADPPYALAQTAWEALAPVARSWIHANGVLVWETGNTVDLPEMPGWSLLEVRRYGPARLHFFLPV